MMDDKQLDRLEEMVPHGADTVLLTGDTVSALIGRVRKAEFVAGFIADKYGILLADLTNGKHHTARTLTEMVERAGENEWEMLRQIGEGVESVLD